MTEQTTTTDADHSKLVAAQRAYFNAEGTLCFSCNRDTCVSRRDPLGLTSIIGARNELHMLTLAPLVAAIGRGAANPGTPG